MLRDRRYGRRGSRVRSLSRSPPVTRGVARIRDRDNSPLPRRRHEREEERRAEYLRESERGRRRDYDEDGYGYGRDYWKPSGERVSDYDGGVRYRDRYRDKHGERDDEPSYVKRSYHPPGDDSAHRRNEDYSRVDSATLSKFRWYRLSDDQERSEGSKGLNDHGVTRGGRTYTGREYFHTKHLETVGGGSGVSVDDSKSVYKESERMRNYSSYPSPPSFPQKNYGDDGDGGYFMLPPRYTTNDASVGSKDGGRMRIRDSEDMHTSITRTRDGRDMHSRNMHIRDSEDMHTNIMYTRDRRDMHSSNSRIRDGEDMHTSIMRTRDGRDMHSSNVRTRDGRDMHSSNVRTRDVGDLCVEEGDMHIRECGDVREGMRLDKLAVDRSLPDREDMLYGEEEGLVRRYLKGGRDYGLPSSQSKAFATSSSEIPDDQYVASFREEIHVPMHRDGSSARMTTTKPYGYDEYGEKSHSRSPLEIGRDYRYPEVGRSERIVKGLTADESFKKTIEVNEEHMSRDVSRMGILNLMEDRIDEFSSREHARENELWEHNPSLQRKLTSDYYDARETLPIGKGDIDASVRGVKHPQYESDLYLDHERAQARDLDEDTDGASWSYEERFDEVPPRECDPRMDDIEESRQGVLISRDRSLPDLSNRVPKRKYATGEKMPEHIGIRVSSPGKIDHDLSGSGDMLDDGAHPVFLSKKKLKKLKSSKAKFVKKLSSGKVIESTPTGARKIDNFGGRNIKNRLGPHPQDVNTSHLSVKKHKALVKKRLGPGPPKSYIPLPWLKNLTAYKNPRNRDDLDGNFHDQEEDPVEKRDSLEVRASVLKHEPSETTEDFKQLVHSAFLKFVKQLNETPAKSKRYMERGKIGGLKCIVCSSSEEYNGTESLALHAFESPIVGLRSQHLAFHKALCTLMGWRSAEVPVRPWVPEKLSKFEYLAIKEDLILWPPVVIIHNISIRNENPDARVIVSNDMLEAKLKDMGLGEKIKVFHGKPANQSNMVVRFNATLSGLQDAERLHMFYAQSKHGRTEFQQVTSGNNEVSSGDTPVATAEKLEEVLYGYLAIAEDLYKLDFDSKRRCMVRSKKEIFAIADAHSTMN